MSELPPSLTVGDVSVLVAVATVVSTFHRLIDVGDDTAGTARHLHSVEMEQWIRVESHRNRARPFDQRAMPTTPQTPAEGAHLLHKLNRNAAASCRGSQEASRIAHWKMNKDGDHTTGRPRRQQRFAVSAQFPSRNGPCFSSTGLLLSFFFFFRAKLT